MPELSFDEIMKEEDHLLCKSYGRYPVAITRGEGSLLWDVNGKEYIDLLGGIAVIALGHCNPEVCKALEKQSHILWHVSNLFYQTPQLDLAKILLSTTHLGKAFFCNSGAEANEACFKLARRYMRTVKNRDAWEIITLTGAFHGRTFGALAATGRESLSSGFEPLTPGFIQVPSTDISAVENAITPHTAAVFFECVQGEAGVKPLPAEYQRQIEKLCREKDILLICDEIQCGLCRTGTFWGFQQAGIKPDAISVAKGLANGLPIGVMLATDEMAKGFAPGSHASTFGGGALVTATAAKVVEIMLRDNLADRAGKLGKVLLEKLAHLRKEFPQTICDIRGMGLIIGIELAGGAPKIWQELLNEGIICNLSHNKTLRLLPALTVPEEYLEKFVETLRKILANGNYK